MKSHRFSRQSFLGADSDSIFAQARVGLVGLGGGGSHIAQQLAHLGFLNFVIYDGDIIEDSNLNRLVGGTEIDVEMKKPKVSIAERVIRGVSSQANIEQIQSRWQDNPQPLQTCDIVFGCVDGFLQRWELQVFSRRFCVPYIDIGLDVHNVGDEGPQMRGQVILTVPGGPCMKCIHFVDDENLSKEGARYGDAGIHPQVVWANGVLASTAVGLAVDLLTGWTRKKQALNVIYLSYDGNTGTVVPDRRLQYVTSGACQHFDASDVGAPIFQEL